MFQANVTGYATLKMELLLLTKFHKTLWHPQLMISNYILKDIWRIFWRLNIVALHH